MICIFASSGLEQGGETDGHVEDHAGHQAFLPDCEPAEQQSQNNNPGEHLHREKEVDKTVTESLEDDRDERVAGESLELPHQIPTIDNLLTNTYGYRKHSPQRPFSRGVREHGRQATQRL
jgi:hypothetical protein